MKKVIVAIVVSMIIFTGCSGKFSNKESAEQIPDLLEETLKSRGFSISYPKGYQNEACGVVQVFGSTVAVTIEEGKLEGAVAYDIESITGLLNGMDDRYQKEGYNVDWGKVESDSILKAYWMKMSKGETFFLKYIIPADGGYYELKSMIDNEEQFKTAEMIMNSFRLVDESWIDPLLTKEFELSNARDTGEYKFTALEDVYLEDDHKSFLLPKGFTMLVGRLQTFSITPPDDNFFLKVNWLTYKLATYEDRFDMLINLFKREGKFVGRYSKTIGKTTYDIIERKTTMGFDPETHEMVELENPSYYLHYKLSEQSFISIHALSSSELENPDLLLVLENMEFKK